VIFSLSGAFCNRLGFRGGTDVLAKRDSYLQVSAESQLANRLYYTCLHFLHLFMTTESFQTGNYCISEGFMIQGDSYLSIQTVPETIVLLISNYFL